MVTDRSLYQSLDDLIADGLQLTADKFQPLQSMEAGLSLQTRHATADVV